MFPDTVYPNATTQTRLESDTADNLAWSHHSEPPHSTSAHSRLTFTHRATPTPIRLLIDMLDNDLLVSSDSRGSNPHAGKRVMVVVGRARRLAVQSHQDELSVLFGGKGHVSGTGGGSVSEVRKTVGDVGAGLIVGSRSCVGLVVLQAAEV